MAVAQEPGKPERRGTEPVEQNQREESLHRQGLSNALGFTGHLPEPQCPRGAATFQGLVPLGQVGGSLPQVMFICLHDQNGANGREPPGWNAGTLEVGGDQCFYGGTQQCLQRR